MVKFIIVFFVVQIVNVILNTIKTCVTAKGQKLSASIINAICFGFYTFVIVLTADEFNVWVKAAITVITNLIGVYFSLWLLEKIKKDKLWVITATAKDDEWVEIKAKFDANSIQYNWIFLNKGIAFTIYSYSQKESTIIKNILLSYNTKFTAIEQNAKL